MGRIKPQMDAVIGFKWCEGADQSLGLPRYATTGAAGADLRANFTDRASVLLAPGERVPVPTGLRMEIPDGFEVQVRPRSGLALRHGIGVLNGPGTIDSDYRGPVGVILINFGAEPFEIDHGSRIAQMVVAPVVQARFQLASSLNSTERGSSGFGSTGQS